MFINKKSTIILWDAVSGMQIKKLAGHSAEVCSVCFSPNSSLIASSSYDK